MTTNIFSITDKDLNLRRLTSQLQALRSDLSAAIITTNISKLAESSFAGPEELLKDAIKFATINRPLQWETQIRNLNPTPEARLAMVMWGKEYSEQHGGSMDFWDSLSEERKHRCTVAIQELKKHHFQQ